MSNEPIRLSKYFSDCGILSRRAAEDEIKAGKVKVNGVVAVLGQKIVPGVDDVEYKGSSVEKEYDEKICIMLNKPRGYVTTMSDEKGRPSVSELVSSAGVRLYPIGRLDMDSDGLLLMTNDGDLANTLTHPSHTLPKIYRVVVKGRVTPDKATALGDPIFIDGKKTRRAKVEFSEYDGIHTTLIFTLFEGRNRQIRRMCSSHGVEVVKLTRTAYGTLTLGHLSLGKWRQLSKKEIEYLSSGKNTPAS